LETQCSRVSFDQFFQVLTDTTRHVTGVFKGLFQVTICQEAASDLVDEIRSIGCREHRDIFQFNHAIDLSQQLSHDTIHHVTSAATMPEPSTHHSDCPTPTSSTALDKSHFTHRHTSEFSNT